MEDKNLIPQTINYKLYNLDANFKSAKNVVNYVNEAQDFYNGKQYPNENFNNMIRVTLNICSMCAMMKASKICGTPIYLAFTADNMDTDTTALRQFDEYNCNKMHLKSSNYQAALNGFVNGTEITFIRWDKDDTTYKGIYKGGLVEEHIDIRNFAVANPYIRDIQNQEYVMFWEDYTIGALKEMVEGTDKEKEAKKEALNREYITNNQDDYKDQYFVNSKLTKLFTRFFRVDGEVYFMCSTQHVDIFKYPHPLSRRLAKGVIKKVIEEYNKIQQNELDNNDENRRFTDYEIDYEDMVMSAFSDEKMTDKEYAKIKEKFSLYPFAIYIPYAQNRFFYGRSDIKSLIPIQKGINFCYSMVLKCAENNAYNKILVKPEALKGQIITNEPSQVLVDYSGFTNQWGIKPMESQPMPNGIVDFADRMITSTRVIYGFNEVMNGDFSNKDISGYAVQLMMKQANSTIEQQQQLFWAYNEDKAAIRLMYYKHYVDKAKYTYELEDSVIQGEQQAQQMLMNGVQNGVQFQSIAPEQRQEAVNMLKRPIHKRKVKEIKGEDLYGVNFDIAVEALQGLNDSKLVEQQMWDNLLLNGGINNISPDILAMYLQASPNVSPRTKAALQNVVDNLKRSENTQLKQQLQELMQKTQQIMNYAKQLEAANGYQGEYLKNLQSEFGNKINAQNKVITGLAKDLDKYRGYDNTVSEGEVKSNNSRGISGSTSQ